MKNYLEKIFNRAPLKIKYLILKMYKYINFEKSNVLKEYLDKKVILMRCLENKLKINPNKEKQEILNVLKNKFDGVGIPYYWTNKYKKENIKIQHDSKSKYNFVMHQNKPLYFPLNMSNQEIKILYNSLLIEQDENSPHLYLTPDFTLQKGEFKEENDIILDVGAAEGIFTLSNIDLIKKAYLFECDEDWIEPLKLTFKPYKEKVEIVNRYVSDTTSDKTITLDDFYNQIDKEEINFIKVDIEGAEFDLLKGAKKLLKNSKNLKLAICTYHEQEDAEIFENFLIEKGYSCEFSKGYMAVFCGEFKYPYLRKGLIRAKKKINDLKSDLLTKKSRTFFKYLIYSS
ncbi:hypothetical protein MBCUT_19180 [Methanobrevibacter cuticularis]|uniref:Methyltransferase FkbM domain-containing protein n=1 Tax=Methanobrevibacter cuticularis TaxID=47311 RepID=A0A166CRJ4_9EURY|nr:FkbM family methyltransferase [Methanobrevibacter cuticularis]KZX14790.1 hypothetical protein MBCUT_19180 [Methanobrevibacter cuticularis]